MTMVMIRLTRRTRDRYRRSWAGVKVAPSRGLMLLIGAAMISLAISAPWLIDKNATVAREQVAVNALEDQRRDCVRAALSGADLQATSLAGVKHAEDTVAVVASSGALWDLVAGILQSGAGATSPAVQEIVSGADQYNAAIRAYATNVADFRRIAEQYRPRQMSECREIGVGILDPLPANPTAPPPTTTPGG